MIKVYYTKEEVWCNLQDEMRRSLVELAVVVSRGQSLARGCIHIGINTNAPGGACPFAHYQQVLCSDDDCPDDTPLVKGKVYKRDPGYADCYVQGPGLWDELE